jgi:hypothetical protein
MVVASSFGSVWFDPVNEPLDTPPKGATFPNMAGVMDIAWGERSGLITFVRKPPEEET